MSVKRESTVVLFFVFNISVTIPEITAELAEQIVNQAAAQQVAGEPTSIQTSAGDILIQSSAGVLHVPEGATAQESGQAGMVIGTEVVEDSGGNHHDEVFSAA